MQQKQAKWPIVSFLSFSDLFAPLFLTSVGRGGRERQDKMPWIYLSSFLPYQQSNSSISVRGSQKKERESLFSFPKLNVDLATSSSSFSLSDRFTWTYFFSRKKKVLPERKKRRRKVFISLFAIWFLQPASQQYTYVYCIRLETLSKDYFIPCNPGLSSSKTYHAELFCYFSLSSLSFSTPSLLLRSLFALELSFFFFTFFIGSKLFRGKQKTNAQQQITEK